MQRYFYIFMLVMMTGAANASCPIIEGETAPSDSISDNLCLDEVEVVSTIKENTLMRRQPSAVSIVSRQQMDAAHVTSLKGVSALVPNFFMPDYGSRLTSAIYIRGIGSRINTPAVGLYVDNMPYADKSAFDFNFYDIERVDVLRGPQGTLYGRNAMGGIVRIYTKNPFTNEGFSVNLGYATGDNHRTISLTHYHHVSPTFAFTGGGYYEGGDGFFRNNTTGKNADHMQAAGGRVRGIWLPADRLSLDFNVSYDYSDEGAYPYFYTGSLTDVESYGELIGTISNNRESSYRRNLLNAGVNIEYKAPAWQMNAVTSYQNLSDRMFMDQDFISADIYTLEQKQRINTITEEITFKNRAGGLWEWVSGVNGMYQNLRTLGPVTFFEDGVSGIIEGSVNGIFDRLRKDNPRMPSMGIALQDRNFVVSSNMDTPSFNLAAFHSSSINWKNWKLTAGLRLEYEKLYMKYYSDSDITFDFNLSMSPMMNFSYPDLKASPVFDGDMNKDYLQVLPKVSLMYRLSEANNIYATISKGHRSGGYNVQMFSDLIQGAMRNQMIANIDEAGKGVVKKMLGEESYNRLIAEGDVSSVVFKPEFSWNYELGTHLNFFNRTLQMDAALFYVKTRDQQIARFAPSGLGRMMVNAGRSRSLGAEFTALWRPDTHWTITANYGYTNAKFTDYDAGDGNDYTGNYVPFVPQHTFNVDAAYTWRLADTGWVRSITLGADCRGAGTLYWTEANNAQQNFYTLLGARLAFATKIATIQLWGRNLTNTHYNTFYFESVSRGFEQHGKPVQAGVDVRFSF